MKSISFTGCSASFTPPCCTARLPSEREGTTLIVVSSVRISMPSANSAAEISVEGASTVAAYRQVRARMVELQQEMAREHSVIMDGRDVGTVVLPDAEVKIYLDAGVEERARRRVGELQEKGETADFEEIKKMIIERDYNDMHRAHSPLKRAADAVSLDSTGMGIDAVLHAILDIVAERVKEK